MAKTYKHGTYGTLGQSVGRGADSVSGLPVYIGRLPVHLTASAGNKTNVPIVLHDLADALKQVGYSADWATFDLCEAIDAHFDNSTQNIGPIAVINVFDPTTMRTATDTTAPVPLVGGRGELADDRCILETCAVAGKVLGTDFTVTWHAGRQRVILQDLTGTMTSPVSLKYRKADPTMVTEALVIGTADDEHGVRTGVQAVAQVYQRTGLVPTMLCAPGWSNKQAVRTAMVGAAHAIDGHWYARVLTDIPTSADTIAAAKDWKNQKGYADPAEVTCWPMARKGSKLYHISTLSVVAAMQTDASNSGIPYQTASNAPVDIEGYHASAGKEANYTTTQANLLNAAGIRTVAFFGGRWALWGAHTAAFQSDGGTDPRDTYDSNIAMLYFILNWFQVNYGREVDAPIGRNRVDAIVNETRAYLDGLRAAGALMSADVAFEEIGSAGDLVRGEFTFHSTATPTPPIRAVTLNLGYSEAGLEGF